MRRDSRSRPCVPGWHVRGTWVRFARTGDPNNKTIPHWPAYDAATRATMIFDTKDRIENDPYAEFRKILSA